MFRSISYYLGAFGTVCLPYETRCKTGRTSAKVRATKSRRTFRKERTRSTPLDPKLTFWYVSYHLGAFGTVWLAHETRCKTGRTSAKVHATKSCQNFSQRTYPSTPLNPNSCFIVFYTIFVHLVPFGCVTKLRAKRAKLMQKFVIRSRVGIFSNERNRSTPLDSKLMFWCVLYYLDAFRTVWLLYKTQYKKRAEVVQMFVP